MKTRSKFLTLLTVGLANVVFFQNCGNGTQFNTTPSTTASSVGGTGSNTGDTAQALKSFQPTFAVRGLNCMACHGVVGSNIVTDFGLGTPNYNPLYKSLSTIEGRSAFNNVENAWQSMTVTGSVYVPRAAISASDAQASYNLSSGTTLANLIQMPNLLGNTSMVSGVTPVGNNAKVVELTSVKIGYPSESEILGLLPSNLQSASVAVSAINVPGVPASSQSGFAVSGNQYVTNGTSEVLCYGDVVVKGSLFLNNLKLRTDSSGCRLYVSNSVFIQGPVSYTGGSGSNLQITSARAILLGFSTLQLGALQSAPANGSVSQVRINELAPVDSSGNYIIKSVGGPYPRFAQSVDSSYNPSGSPINGVPSTTFFDNIVLDSLKIGSKLYDAGDANALANVVNGEAVVHDNDQFQGSYGGNMIAVNYSGLLLNAPHVHSRYAGSLKGVIIADVAMLARNPTANSTIEQFVFDPVFDNVPLVLPALKTNVLQLVK